MNRYNICICIQSIASPHWADEQISQANGLCFAFLLSRGLAAAWHRRNTAHGSSARCLAERIPMFHLFSSAYFKASELSKVINMDIKWK